VNEPKGTVYVQTNRGGVTNINLLIQRNLTILCQKPVFHTSAIVLHYYSTLCHIWNNWKLFNVCFWHSSNSKRSNDLWICPCMGFHRYNDSAKTHFILLKWKHPTQMLMFSDDELPSTTKKTRKTGWYILYMTTNGSKVRLLKCYSLLLLNI